LSGLSEKEREEIIQAIRQGRALPSRYRGSLFEEVAETELIWPGKTSDVERVALPFQSIEHIDEPRAETVIQPTLFSMDSTTGRQVGGWTNKLIWGDNKLILSSLSNGPLREQIDEAGGLKLVYIDPPFDVGADFSLDVEIGGEDVRKEPSVVEQMAYRDTWGRGRDSFISMIAERLRLIHSLLANDGSIYVHCDWRMSGALRLVLDEIFGSDNFVNEIIWHYRSFHGQTKSYFPRKHDVIFFYQKSAARYFSLPRKDIPLEEMVDFKNWGKYIVNNDEIRGNNYPTDVRFKRNLDKWTRQNPGLKPGAEDILYRFQGQPEDDTWDIPYLDPKDKSERLEYPTQKPEALLKRILEASSRPGDLVADFFVGSGTTAAVAEKLGRKWIAADLGRFAIHTTRKRLISVQRELAAEDKSYRAFEILNLGSYERQYFAGVDMSLPEDQRRAQSLQRHEHFLETILQAYGAQRSEQAPGFHGVKDNAYVLVGPIDAPITQSDVRAAIAAATNHGVSRIDMLGFEFEMGIKPAMAEEARELGLNLTLRYIPNDVFDKRAISRGQVKFFDVGYVDIVPRQDKKSGEVTIELADFGVFYAQDDADAAASGLINGASRLVIDGGQVVRVSKDKKGLISKEILTKSWTDWVDYWAVDFDYASQKEVINSVQEGKEVATWTGRYIFENQWQDYRLRNERTIATKSAPHIYDTPGEYAIAVKVVDVFGNDTTKVVKFQVK
jgi:DNA modification methylase